MAVLIERRRDTNVGEQERWVSLVGGGALAAFGIAQKSWGGLALAALGGAIVYRGYSGHCETYHALGINTAERQENESVPYELGVRVDKSVLINRSPEELYRFWRNFENLPKFMQHLESVTVQDTVKSHWQAKGPLGYNVEWDAEIINEIENELISWRSLPGSQVENAGSVKFQALPHGRGTEVRVELQYNPPAGYVGAAIAKLFGEEPNTQIHQDLRRFKQLMETGEIATIKGQPSGRASSNVEQQQVRHAQPTAVKVQDAEKQSGKVFSRDWVTQSSEESFPASDPPSWTPNSLQNA